MPPASIREFGAVGDGNTPDHTAVQATIDACASRGGGTVVVPAGSYCCGTVFLKSNVDLRLEPGAVILASRDPASYQRLGDSPDPKLSGLRALVVADRQQNVTISGAGTIDGGASPGSTGTGVRPALVLIRDCRNVHVTDVNLKDSDFWTLHLQRCEDVFVRGITIRADQHRMNTDGIDPDGCRNVFISDCHISTGDDSIVLKSTDGTPCENVVVSNCVLSSHETALKLGTEALGPIRNVAVSNCIVRESGYGIGMYMKDGSAYENISFANIVMETSRDFSILVDVMPRHHGTTLPGQIRDVRFSNITVRGPGRCYIEGSTVAPIRNLTMDGVCWEITGHCRSAGARKPRGTIRFTPDPNEVNHAANPFQCTAVNVEGLWMRAARFGMTNGIPADRGLCYLRNVRGGCVEITESFSLPPGLEKIRCEECRNVVV